MKKIISTLIIAAIVMMNGTANAAVNDLISINFGDPYKDGAVALKGTVDVWDNYTSAVQKEAIPVESTKSVNISWDSSGYSVTKPENTAFNNVVGIDKGSVNTLMNSYIYTIDKETHNITLSGLDKNANYALYIYSQDFLDAKNGQMLSVSVNKEMFGQTEPSDVSASSYKSGLNYLTGELTVNDSGTLNITYSSTKEGTGFAVINGLQLLQTSESVPPAPVPEPASVFLMGFGGLLAALRLRKSVTV
jgi:hypothetical protein